MVITTLCLFISFKINHDRNICVIICHNLLLGKISIFTQWNAVKCLFPIIDSDTVPSTSPPPVLYQMLKSPRHRFQYTTTSGSKTWSRDPDMKLAGSKVPAFCRLSVLSQLSPRQHTVWLSSTKYSFKSFPPPIPILTSLL